MSSIVKAVISIYRRGEEKPIERYKARISVTEDSTKQGIDNFKKHLANFLGLKEQASKLGLGSFDLKLYRLVKGNGKTEREERRRGVNRLLENINTINPEFAKHIDWSTLLTTIVENLHAVSHFKHETFSILQYAMDFGTISKESLKRITKWKASYFTHPASYYPVSQTNMPLSAAKFMTSLPAESISKEAEITMKEWAEHYRPVRQRTVRSETTKDKAGALPPAVYEKAKTGTWNELSFPDSCAKSSTASVSNESVPLSTSSDCTVVTLVSDEKIPQVLIGTEPEPFQMDEFESDSDSDYDETESEEIVEHRNAITRSGRQIKASVRFDL